MGFSLVAALRAEDFRGPDAPITTVRSHERGKEISAFVGEVLAGVEATKHPWKLAGAQPREDCWIVWKAFGKKKAKKILVSRKVKLSVDPFWQEAIDEFKLSLTDDHERAFEITLDGEFTGRFISAWGGLRTGATIEPADCHFGPVFIPDQAVSILNAELIYMGRSATALRFLYQEYTPNDLLHAPSMRHLEYPTDSGTIRARRFRVEVLEATSELIRYKVLEDGTEGLVGGEN